MKSVILVKKVCKVCKNMRKYVKDTPRDQFTICGNCWPWPQPNELKETPSEKELIAIREMLDTR